MTVIALLNMVGLTVLSLLAAIETSLPDQMINSVDPRTETVHSVSQTGLIDLGAGVHLHQMAIMEGRILTVFRETDLYLFALGFNLTLIEQSLFVNIPIGHLSLKTRGIAAWTKTIGGLILRGHRRLLDWMTRDHLPAQNVLTTGEVPDTHHDMKISPVDLAVNGLVAVTCLNPGSHGEDRIFRMGGCGRLSNPLISLQDREEETQADGMAVLDNMRLLHHRLIRHLFLSANHQLALAGVDSHKKQPHRQAGRLPQQQKG